MTDRDRLIELIRKSQCVEILDNYADDFKKPCPIESLANYLLDNGIIVAPMPMADWLKQELIEYVQKRCMEEL